MTYFQVFLSFLEDSLRLPFVAFVDDVAITLHSSKVPAMMVAIDTFLTSMGLVLNTRKSELLALRPECHIPHPPCPMVEHVLHLGHPLPAMLDEKQALALVVDELKRSLKVFHDAPLPVMHRIRLTNIVILPTLLHRMECLWIPLQSQREVASMLLSFCLGVTGLPPHMSPKTIFSKPPFGLGLHYFLQQ